MSTELSVIIDEDACTVATTKFACLRHA
ncbi:hypothetical protein SPHINGO391_240019 [Sphingomonas aurantiaca]|uniref:Uncharacterized protein n=1 Tax=Sphingomonas aurantiaca TaxID=185949 RepID=A0A5E7XWI6_9SPHN|nr:hypothetical protein SPHINGO391_240019 [Sphingomonas aurantiaca]